MAVPLFAHQGGCHQRVNGAPMTYGITAVSPPMAAPAACCGAPVNEECQDYAVCLAQDIHYHQGRNVD
jgi:hypothetical protein